MVPPSTVVNVKISTPEDVRVGAVAPAQSTEAGQVKVALPPLVTIKVNELELPVAIGLVKVSD